MGSVVLKGVVRSGQVETAEPIDLPDGPAVTILSEPNGVEIGLEGDRPRTPAEIAATLAAMEMVEPFDMTDEERAAAEAWEKGDSQAWLVADGEICDLTERRVRKPLLGSGAAVATGFSRAVDSGVLIVATDGFCNYVKREAVLKKVLWTDFAVLARQLVEMVRLPSGEFWDDIGIVICRRRARSMSASTS